MNESINLMIISLICNFGYSTKKLDILNLINSFTYKVSSTKIAPHVNITLNYLIDIMPTITVNEEVQHLLNVCSIEINIVKRMSKDPTLKVMANKKLFMSGCNFSCLVLCG